MNFFPIVLRILQLLITLELLVRFKWELQQNVLLQMNISIKKNLLKMAHERLKTDFRRSHHISCVWFVNVSCIALKNVRERLTDQKQHGGGHIDSWKRRKTSTAISWRSWVREAWTNALDISYWRTLVLWPYVPALCDMKDKYRWGELHFGIAAHQQSVTYSVLLIISMSTGSHFESSTTNKMITMQILWPTLRDPVTKDVNHSAGEYSPS